MFPRGKNSTENVNVSSSISIQITNQIRTDDILKRKKTPEPKTQQSTNMKDWKVIRCASKKKLSGAGCI